MRLVTIALVLLFALSACGQGDPDNEEGHMLEGYEDAVEQAHDVGEEVQQAEERRRRALEENDG